MHRFRITTERSIAVVARVQGVSNTTINIAINTTVEAYALTGTAMHA